MIFKNGMKSRQNILDTDTSLFALVLFHLFTDAGLSCQWSCFTLALWRHVINLTELFQTLIEFETYAKTRNLC